MSNLVESKGIEPYTVSLQRNLASLGTCDPIMAEPTRLELASLFRDREAI